MTDADMLDALIDQHNDEISELYESLMTMELQLVDQLEVGGRGMGTWILWVHLDVLCPVLFNMVDTEITELINIPWLNRCECLERNRSYQHHMLETHPR